MKLTMNRIRQGSEEVIIRYREMTPQIEAIAGMVQGTGQKLSGIWQEERILISPEEVFYLESVDGASFVYLKDKVCRVSGGVGELFSVPPTQSWTRARRASRETVSGPPWKTESR